MSGDRKEHTQVFGAEQEADFERIVQEGITNALNLIRARFEAPKTGEEEIDNLEFHTRPHTEDVVQRTRLILETIQKHNPEVVRRRDVLFGTLIAAYHDVVQKYDLDGMARKMRKAKNETESAEELVEFMDKVNERGHGEIFSEQDEETAFKAIIGTVPSFKGGTVIQPNVVEKAPLVARALALADLGSAGMSGSEKYVPESFKLFLEENVDVKAGLNGMKQLSDARKEYYRERVVAWFASQKLFIEGRKARLETEIAPIPEPSRSAVRGLFNQFDDSLEAVGRKLDEIKSMSFEQLAEEMRKHTSLGMRQAETSHASSREGVGKAREARIQEIRAQIEKLEEKISGQAATPEEKEAASEDIKDLRRVLSGEAEN